MDKLSIVPQKEIENRIYTIREVQVMLDSHLAELYGVDVKILNQAVKRNQNRFPSMFMFQLAEQEWEFLRSQSVTIKSDSKNLRSQNATLEDKRGAHRKYLPYVFTEQGVAMLSSVLRSDTAVKVSIQIINAFVGMRKYIAENAAIFQRLDRVERKQIETDEKFERVFKALESDNLKPDKGIFFDGQVFDAYTFFADLIRKANKSIILIDNYIDDTVLTLFAKRQKGVTVTIYTKTISKQLKLDLQKYNSQYPTIEITEFKDAHDRFMIIDSNELYHIGASLKDLGKKWFAFSKMDKEALNIIDKLNKVK